VAIYSTQKQSGALQRSRLHQSAEEAAREAMVLNSVLKITTDSAERRKRRLESIKPPGPIVDAPKQTEATTQPSDDGNI
jgi:hypothetical protein